MAHKQSHKEKSLEIAAPKTAEAHGAKDARRKAKKLKVNSGDADGDKQPQFFPTPTNTAFPENSDNLKKTTKPKRVDSLPAITEQNQAMEADTEGEPKLSAKERKRAERQAAKLAKKTAKKSAKVSEGVLDTTTAALSAEDAPEKDGPDDAADVGAKKKEKKKKKKSKSDKNPAEDSHEKAKKDKKERKEKKQSESPQKPAAPSADGLDPSEDNTNQASVPLSKRTNSQRFIVFVGNLPFSATAKSIEEHFSSIAPFTVRLLTDKRTKKPRGCAFVEFEGYDRMKSCLKLYHHSSFDDGKSPARKINVELTAGGGGKSEGRMEKIKEKNEKLKEERKREHEKEDKDKDKSKKRKRASEANADEIAGSIPGNTNGATDEAQEQEHGGMHPSRRARLAF